MKRKLIPSTLAAIAWWRNNPNALKADLFVVSLPNGQTIYATDGQWDLTVPGAMSPLGSTVTFKAMQYGLWSRGPITSEAGFKCTAGMTRVSVIPKIGSTYPGLNISTLNAAVNHLFDGAHVWIWTAYMPFGKYGTVSIVEPKFQGWILRSPQIGRLLCQFDVGDPFFLLNQKVPSRLMQSHCYKSFTDVNCGLAAVNYTVNFTAGAGSSRYTLTPASAFTQADGYFTQGTVTCLTGANAGLSQTVKGHTGGVVSFVVPWLLPVQVGDTFSAIKGCDQTPTTCAGMTRANGTAEPQNWQLRFGGTPYVPAPTTAL